MKSLTTYRKDRFLSQEALSNELSNFGIKVSPASIAMYETGQRTPPLYKAQAIAKFFGVGLDDIYFGKKAHDERALLTPTGTDS